MSTKTKRKKTTAVKKPATKEAPKRPTTVMEVCYRVARDGAKAVKMMDPPPSPKVLAEAIKRLETDTPGDAQTLATVAREMYVRFGEKHQGRPAPKPGDERTYKAFRTKSGAAFVRTPLDTVGVEKGQPCRVTFGEGWVLHTNAKHPSPVRVVPVDA